MKRHKRIWLQDNGPHDEITWCSDHINDGDVGYVRADIAESLGRDFKAAKALLERAGPLASPESPAGLKWMLDVHALLARTIDE